MKEATHETSRQKVSRTKAAQSRPVGASDGGGLREAAGEVIDRRAYARWNGTA